MEDFLEVRLSEREDFLKIVETLTRIGISTKDNTLVQTCHILHKRGKYYICHFKELFKLDGVMKTEITEEDIQRRNAIAHLLSEWNLCEIVKKGDVENRNLSKLKIVPHKQKQNYILKSNYTIGGKK